MVTNKQIQQIRKLRKEGLSYRKISKKLNLSVSAVYYNSEEKIKKKIIQQSMESFRKKTLEERRKTYKKRAEYLRNYQRKKYQTDKNFRLMKLEKSREYYKNNGNKRRSNRT